MGLEKKDNLPLQGTTENYPIHQYSSSTNNKEKKNENS